MVVPDTEHTELIRDVAALIERERTSDRRLDKMENNVEEIKKDIIAVKSLAWRILLVVFVLGVGNIAARYGLDNILLLLRSL